MPSLLEVCYRQTVSYRYVLISVLATTMVLLLTWSEDDYMYGVLRNDQLALARNRPQPIAAATAEGSTSVERIGRVTAAAPDELAAIGAEREIELLQSRAGHCPGNSGKPSQIILLTYGRSGSSLTADILQQHPDVFFHYEPLHNLAKSYTKIQKDYKGRHNKYLHLTSIPGYNQDAEKVCELLLTCNYTHLPPPAYKNMLLNRSPNTRPLSSCIKHAHDNTSRIHDCLKINSALCTLRPIQLIKTIRMTAESVGNLMDKLPNLKMVYLVRDPRGSYLSKLKAFPWDFSKNATYEATRICPRLQKDIEASLSLNQKYPGRVHITRYETIAEDPVKTSRKMYEFLCLDFTPEIERYIRQNNMAGTNRSEGNIYSVQRKDSKAASYAWRQKMDIAQAMTFDEECSQVYEKLGYLPVDSEEHLRDVDMPLKVDVEFAL